MSSTQPTLEVSQRPVPKTPHWLDSWHVNPSSNTNYSSVDGLRGIAILLVMACHLVYVNPNAGPLVLFLGGFIGGGSSGVPIFFAISGFLISFPFWIRKVRNDVHAVPKGYGWRRFWKIYPPLAATVLVFTPVYIWRAQDWSYLVPAAQWFAGLAFLVPVDGRLNPVMWSLVVEIQFYITIPILFVCLKRFSVKHSLWILTAGLLAVPNAARWLAYGGQGPAFHPYINGYYPTGLDFFALGVMIAGLEAAQWTRKGWAKLGTPGFLLLFLVLLSYGWSNMRGQSPVWLEPVQHWMLIAAAGLMLCYIADARYMVSQWLCFSPLRWLGLISYELYLIHQPVALWMRKSLGPCDGAVGKYIVVVGSALIVSMVSSALFYKFFSLPILQAGRKNHLRPA